MNYLSNEILYQVFRISDKMIKYCVSDGLLLIACAENDFKLTKKILVDFKFVPNKKTVVEILKSNNNMKIIGLLMKSIQEEEFNLIFQNYMTEITPRGHRYERINLNIIKLLISNREIDFVPYIQDITYKAIKDGDIDFVKRVIDDERFTFADDYDTEQATFIDAESYEYMIEFTAMEKQKKILKYLLEHDKNTTYCYRPGITMEKIICRATRCDYENDDYEDDFTDKIYSFMGDM